MGVRHSKHITRGPRWKALRMQALRRDGFACTSCGARGRLECHHIKPVRTHPELAYDLDNLACLCASCHSRQTAIENGAFDHPGRQKWRDFTRQLVGDKPM